MSEQEKADLMNKIYAVVFEALAPHEHRGYNAHRRAQVISENVLGECQVWVQKQKE